MSTRRPDPRARRSRGVSRSRLAREARRSTRPLVVILLGLVLTAALAGWLVTQISNTFGRSTYEVRFGVGDAFGIFEGFDEVRFRGVPAGTIARIERHGSRLVLVAKVRSGYGPVYRNARAEVRPITPLNDVYLDIVDPGTPSAGRADPGTALPARQTTTSTTVPDVLDGLDATTRRSAHRLLDNLGNGLQDGGLSLRRAFVALGPFLRDAGTLTREVALHRRQTRRLVHDTGILTETLADRELQLRRLVRTGAATFGTLGRSESDLDGTLAELAPTVEELRSSLQSVNGVAGTLDTALVRLRPVAQRLPKGLSDLRRLSGTLQPAARRLRPAVTALAPWTTDVEGFLKSVAGITGGLLPQTPVLDRTADDLVKCQKGVIGFFQWNASLTKMGDEAGGPIPRGNLAVGVPDLGVPGLPKREPVQACSPGKTIRGVVRPEDEH